MAECLAPDDDVAVLGAEPRHRHPHVGGRMTEYARRPCLLLHHDVGNPRDLPRGRERCLLQRGPLRDLELTPRGGDTIGSFHSHPRVGLARRGGEGLARAQRADGTVLAPHPVGSGDPEAGLDVVRGGQLPGMYDVLPPCHQGRVLKRARAQLLRLRTRRCPVDDRGIAPVVAGQRGEHPSGDHRQGEGPGRDGPPHPAQVTTSTREVRQVRDGHPLLGGLGEVLHPLLRHRSSPPTAPASARGPRGHA